uniref:Hemoglobin subunit epsilon 1 n=1 Tax=Fundulus heteroclitus TaxID=8078 RepID=A0A3Q2NPW2_FUNHE
MVEWTDAERNAIATLWSNIDVGEIGPQALARLLVVFPWTQRYFSTFGDLSTPAAIAANPKVAQHGKTVMGGLEIAVKNMDNIKAAYAKLSVMHSEKLHVDPDNFRVCHLSHQDPYAFLVCVHFNSVLILLNHFYRFLLNASQWVWLPSLAPASSPLVSRRLGRSSWLWWFPLWANSTTKRLKWQTTEEVQQLHKSS